MARIRCPEGIYHRATVQEEEEKNDGSAGNKDLQKIHSNVVKETETERERERGAIGDFQLKNLKNKNEN